VVSEYIAGYLRDALAKYDSLRDLPPCSHALADILLPVAAPSSLLPWNSSLRITHPPSPWEQKHIEMASFLSALLSSRLAY
jgi:hypothetical protein